MSNIKLNKKTFVFPTHSQSSFIYSDTRNESSWNQVERPQKCKSISFLNKIKVRDPSFSASCKKKSSKKLKMLSLSKSIKCKQHSFSTSTLSKDSGASSKRKSKIKRKKKYSLTHLDFAKFDPTSIVILPKRNSR